MRLHSFNPQAEKTALSDAIMRFRYRWEQRRTLNAIVELCDAIDRADEVCTELRHCQPALQSDLALIALNVQLLIGIARHELARVQEDTVEEIGHRIADDDRQPTVCSSPLLAAGTILSCPQCEEGMYKVITRASVANLVLDDGVLLQDRKSVV